MADDVCPDLDLEVDPKLGWALRHPECFPVDVNRADYALLLRIPGVGVKSAQMIVAARRYGRVRADQLKKLGVVMKRAVYFIACRELPVQTIQELRPERVRQLLVRRPVADDSRQLKLDFKE